ncbi:RER1B-like protein, partial [Tanacetum coccineum]
MTLCFIALGQISMENENRIKSAVLYPWRLFHRHFQIYLDKTVPHARLRWLVAAILASLFALRVFYLRGFYLVSFCLAIYVLFILVFYATPFVNGTIDEPYLPVTTGSDEFKPFIGRFTEFQL